MFLVPLCTFFNLFSIFTCAISNNLYEAFSILFEIKLQHILALTLFHFYATGSRVLSGGLNKSRFRAVGDQKFSNMQIFDSFNIQLSYEIGRLTLSCISAWTLYCLLPRIMLICCTASVLVVPIISNLTTQNSFYDQVNKEK